MATKGSASLLGRDDIGYIAPGMAADFFLVDLNRIELVGGTYDVKSMLGTVGLKGSVDYTVVNGKIVVEHGRLTGLDEDVVNEKATKVVDQYLKR